MYARFRHPNTLRPAQFQAAVVDVTEAAWRPVVSAFGRAHRPQLACGRWGRRWGRPMQAGDAGLAAYAEKGQRDKGTKGHKGRKGHKRI